MTKKISSVAINDTRNGKIYPRAEAAFFGEVPQAMLGASPYLVMPAATTTPLRLTINLGQSKHGAYIDLRVVSGDKRRPKVLSQRVSFGPKPLQEYQLKGGEFKPGVATALTKRFADAGIAFAGHAQESLRQIAKALCVQPGRPQDGAAESGKIDPGCLPAAILGGG